MKNANRSEYTAHDFQTWRSVDGLDIAPKFQRRAVWTTPAKSYLIDTLIRSMPVPPLFLRTIQSKDRKKIIREVVDGQQRISAVLDYVDNKYRLSAALDSPYAGRSFSKLPPDIQDAILTYPFICEVLQGVSDKQVLEIFSRLNQYSVPLNEQELRNGTYFGYFKQLAYRLGYDYVDLWRDYGLFSDQKIARMLEAEFVSELLIAEIAGMQDKKRTISDFYEMYDQQFEGREKFESRFRKIMDVIANAIGEAISATPFKKPLLFYSLFCAIYHRAYGIPGEKIASPKKSITALESQQIGSAIASLSAVLEQFADQEEEDPEEEADELSSRERRFAIAAAKQTDNIEPRRIRMEMIYRTAFGSK